jgi:hypothetical protein
MEPPSLTRWPRCPFCVLAVEDILVVSMASDGGCGADYQSQAFGIGRVSALVFPALSFPRCSEQRIGSC